MARLEHTHHGRDGVVSVCRCENPSRGGAPLVAFSFFFHRRTLGCKQRATMFHTRATARRWRSCGKLGHDSIRRSIFLAGAESTRGRSGCHPVGTKQHHTHTQRRAPSLLPHLPDDATDLVLGWVAWTVAGVPRPRTGRAELLPLAARHRHPRRRVRRRRPDARPHGRRRRLPPVAPRPSGAHRRVAVSRDTGAEPRRRRRGTGPRPFQTKTKGGGGGDGGKASRRGDGGVPSVVAWPWCDQSVLGRASTRAAAGARRTRTRRFC